MPIFNHNVQTASTPTCVADSASMKRAKRDLQPPGVPSGVLDQPGLRAGPALGPPVAPLGALELPG